MSTTVCTVCGCKILEGPTRSCPRCETPHHEDCWTYNGGCGVYACNPNTKAVLVPKPAPRVAGLTFAQIVAGLVATVCVVLLKLNALTTGVAQPPPPPAVHMGEAPRQAAPWVGHRAPDFAIRDLEGKVQKLSEIRRGRVMILSFWLKHCSDCMPFVPGWADIYNKYEENSELVLVNVAAYANDPEPIREFCKQYHIGGRVLLDGVNQAVPAYQLGTLTTLIIDSEGVIRFRESQAGASSDKVSAMVEKLLAQRKH